MIITISGVPGSGKSTVARRLAERLGYTQYSMGDMRGQIALRRGITIDELNRLGETDPTTDSEVDEYQRELGRKQDDFVVDGRLSWHFIPDSFKVFLECDPKEGARRIFGAKRKKDPTRSDERAYASIDEAERAIRDRVASDELRYQKHYGIRFNDPKNFDLVIDTTAHAGAEDTLRKILDALRERGVGGRV